MPRTRSTVPAPTADEIKGFDNVPTVMAARFLGTSDVTIRYALQQGRAPFGFATQGATGSWTYNISPGQLIEYKRGVLPMYSLGDVTKVMTIAVEQLVNAKMENLQKVLNAAMGG